MGVRKKQINVYKFLRVATDPQAIKVKGLYARRIYINDLEIAIEAYILGDFLYMWKKCKNQTGDRLKTYFARYNMTMPTNFKEYVVPGGRV